MEQTEICWCALGELAVAQQGNHPHETYEEWAAALEIAAYLAAAEHRETDGDLSCVEALGPRYLHSNVVSVYEYAIHDIIERKQHERNSLERS